MAKAPEKKDSKATETLVPVTKDGQTIEIHPDQIEQHARLGWVKE